MSTNRMHSQENDFDQASNNTLKLAQEVLLLEAEEIHALAKRLDSHFLHAVDLIFNCRGRVVVSGIGKSGHIGGKIASTLASTGTPAFFMHPAEASHGDLGMITQDDVVITLSNSGESEEIMSILSPLKRIGAKIIAITGNPASSLAMAANVHLSARVSKEACPLGLAPTTSSTVALALGDALALCVLDQRNFTADDFARSHPGGRLGRRLLVHVGDIMRRGDDIPKVSDQATLSAGLLEMSNKGLGLTSVLDQQGALIGVFTDGDLRRALDKEINISATNIASLMQRNPLTIHENQLAITAVETMEKHKINALLVVDEKGTLIGAINMHDLLRAKVV